MPDVRRVAVHHHERRHVLHDLRAPAADRQPAEAAELVDRRQAADDGAVAHLHVARQRAIVGEDHVVAHDARQRARRDDVVQDGQGDGGQLQRHGVRVGGGLGRRRGVAVRGRQRVGWRRIIG